jgi:hypothetical protein
MQLACNLVEADMQARLLVDTMGDSRNNCNESFLRLFERDWQTHNVISSTPHHEQTSNSINIQWRQHIAK